MMNIQFRLQAESLCLSGPTESSLTRLTASVCTSALITSRITSAAEKVTVMCVLGIQKSNVELRNLVG